MVKTGLKLPESPNTVVAAVSNLFVRTTTKTKFVLTDETVVAVGHHPRYLDLNTPEQDVKAGREDHYAAQPTSAWRPSTEMKRRADRLTRRGESTLAQLDDSLLVRDLRRSVRDVPNGYYSLSARLATFE